MKIFLTALFISLGLSACATNSQYGSYVDSADVEAAVAADVVSKLQAEYPAANTTFSVGNMAQTSFGQQLDQALRNNGFATSVEAAADYKALNYVLDQVYSNIYRVTVYINGVPYSRAYQKNDNGIVPIGTWTKMGG